MNKVEDKKQASLMEIISGQGAYRFTKKLHKEIPQVSSILSKSHQYDVGTGVLKTLNNIAFFEIKPKDGHEYTSVLGKFGSKRVYRWIRSDYINEPEGFDTYRVVLPKANGSGAIGEVLSTPLIGEPLIGFTQTFISIGYFKTRAEAEACLKYVKTKFARTMLGVLKVTQDNPKDKWKYVPLQDFGEGSDIDWSKSVSEIDQQLYRKYGLDAHEIEFIESKVKAME